jgi:hypothetical protein
VASMSRTMNVITAAFLILIGSACTYQRAYLSYGEQSSDVAVQADSWEGERLGVVRASEGGAIWKDCTTLAEASVWVLVEETKKLGGNAIGDFRWVPQHPQHSSEAPMCRQRWGWFLIWPALLTPAFQSAGVEAVAYRVADPAAAHAGLYMIPDSEAERLLLAERIVTEVSPRP